MGCASSTFQSRDDEFVPKLGTASSALGHHIVRLTSSSYGLLSLEPTIVTARRSPPTPTTPLAVSDQTPNPKIVPPAPQEIINSWDLMEGLDPDGSFRFCAVPSKPTLTAHPFLKENSNPNTVEDDRGATPDECAPGDNDRVVIYTTTLRGVRKTFEDCNAARAVLLGSGVVVLEKDVSMDIGFREELKALMKDSGGKITLPRVFVRGRDVGGAEEVARMAEDGVLGRLLDGIPKRKSGESLICKGCGNVRFVPCFRCNGSCKVASSAAAAAGGVMGKAVIVARCGDCNENGLVLCPLCS